MKLTYLILTLLISFGNIACQAQNKQVMDTINPLLCNPESGICEIPTKHDSIKANTVISSQRKSIKVIYFTDPICSSCWGIEPQLRKLKLEYGHDLEIEYRMGGLLPDWSYNSGGISKPSDVAHHWDEVSLYYDMPIDGDVWLKDPLHSSYPPSIAFKAAQIQNNEKAILFLRELREMVFLKKINIAKWEHIQIAAKNIGLDVDQLKKDFEGKAEDNFEQDLKLAKELGVRGFPTMFFTDTTGKTEVVYGSKPYVTFKNTIAKLNPKVIKRNYDSSWKNLFTIYPSLTAKEFSELSGIARNEAEVLLNELTTQQKLLKLTTKNGSLWTIQSK